MGDVLVVGSCSGKLGAFERDTGELVWEYDITLDGDQTNFHGDALVLDDLLLIGTDGQAENGTGHLYAFDWASGEVRWKTAVTESPIGGRGVATDIQSIGSRVYATTLADEFTCYDAANGDVQWQHASTFDETSFVFNGTAVVTPAGIFFGGLDGHVYALDPDNGNVRWKKAVGGRIQTSVALSTDGIFVGTSTGLIVRLAPDTGEITGRIDLGMMPARAMACVDDRIVVYADWVEEGGSLVCVDAALDSVLWRRQVGDGDTWSSAKPYVTDGGVIVGTSGGAIYEYRVDDGELIWGTRVEGTVRGIGVTDDILYVGTLGGTLYAMLR